MESTDREGLARFARERHVHYELAPEEAGAGEEREVTGFAVRLFATPGEAGLQPPGSPRHDELLRDLRSFAERLVASADAAERAEIVPTTAPALYASTEVPGADEVEITLRVRCDVPEHRAGGSEDRCVGEIRERLEAVGVPRR